MPDCVNSFYQRTHIYFMRKLAFNGGVRCGIRAVKILVGLSVALMGVPGNCQERAINAFSKTSYSSLCFQQRLCQLSTRMSARFWLVDSRCAETVAMTYVV